VGPYIHFPIRLHDIVLNKLRTGKTLPFCHAQNVTFHTERVPPRKSRDSHPVLIVWK
jgi:hypothetical protein